MSYANKLKYTQNTTVYPNNNHGITMNIYPEIQMEEYLIALGNIIEPQKIHAASRIANNRICFYLTEKELADKLIKNHKHIMIDNKYIEINPLISPTTKIIISNCFSSIPNHLLEQKFNQLGFKLASPINSLRIGTRQERFKHILSFRRQVYIMQEENLTIPESINIQHENINHKIYLMEDNLRCNKCHRHGHTDNQCHQTTEQQTQAQSDQQINNIPTTLAPTQYPEQTTISQEIQNNYDKPPTSHAQDQVSVETAATNNTNLITTTKTTKKQERNISLTDTKNSSTHITQEKQQTKNIAQQSEQEWKQQLEEFLGKRPNLSQQDEDNDETNTTQKTVQDIQQFLDEYKNKTQTPNKRPALTPASSEDNLNLQPTQDKNKKQPKKQKSNNELDDELIKIKEEMAKSPEKYIITYEQFKDLIENAHGNKDKISLANEYTSETDKLITMITDLYPLLEDPKTKNKFTRLKNKIRPPTKQTPNTSSQNDDHFLEY